MVGQMRMKRLLRKLMDRLAKALRFSASDACGLSVSNGPDRRKSTNDTRKPEITRYTPAK